MKHLLIIIIALVLNNFSFGQCRMNTNLLSTLFFDDFSGPQIDATKWTIASKCTGHVNYLPQNVFIDNGVLHLKVKKNTRVVVL